MNNRELVFSIIKKSIKNLTAYEILDKFQKIKKTQPMTIYRALDSLIEEGEFISQIKTKLSSYVSMIMTKITFQQLLFAKNAVLLMS